MSGYTEEEVRELLRVVGAFCEKEIAPRAREIDETGEFFPDLVRKGAEIGLQGLIFTEDLRIDPAGFAPAHETTELISSYSAAVALAFSVARLHGYLLARYAPEPVRDRWLPGLIDGTAFGAFALSEPHSGTDVRAGRTVARRTPGGDYLISGEKAWITQSPAADFAIVLTKLESADRDADTAAFVIPLDTPGVSVGRDEDMLGFRGMPMAGLSFDDCRVPAEWRLGVDGFRGMLEGLNLARLDRPLAGIRFGDSAGLQRWVHGYIAADLARRADPAYSADLALGYGMRTVLSALGGECGAIDPAFLDLYGFVACGPPASALRELLALARAGIVTFIGADAWVTADRAAGVWRSGSPGVPGHVRARTLIDAPSPVGFAAPSPTYQVGIA